MYILVWWYNLNVRSVDVDFPENNMLENYMCHWSSQTYEARIHGEFQPRGSYNNHDYRIFPLLELQCWRRIVTSSTPPPGGGGERRARAEIPLLYNMENYSPFDKAKNSSPAETSYM